MKCTTYRIEQDRLGNLQTRQLVKKKNTSMIVTVCSEGVNFYSVQSNINSVLSPSSPMIIIMTIMIAITVSSDQL